MKPITFEGVAEGHMFLFENMTMRKRLGSATPAKDVRHPVDYNAVNVKTGDYWEMDNTDNVLVFPAKEDDNG